MALIRGFSKVDKDGKIAIPELIRKWAQLAPDCLIDFRITRAKDASRRPHIYFFRSDHPPYLSPMEVTMMEGTTVINKDGKIILDDSILEEAKLELGHLVEMKLAGSRGAYWVILHHRVHYSPTSVPEATRVGQKAK